MASSGPDEPSFDPRTWRDRADAPGRPQAGEPTLDPKAWRPAPAPPPVRPARPRRRIVAGVAIVVILGGGASLALWSRRLSPSAPAGVAMPARISAAARQAAGERRALILSGPQELPAALSSAGVPAADVQAAARAAQSALGAAPGQLRVVLTLVPAGTGVTLARLEARGDSGAGVIVTRGSDGRYVGRAVTADLTTQLRVVRGEMDVNSFYSSAVAAGVTDSLIPAFAQAFAYDFDFEREIKPGDVFEAAFEQTIDPSGHVVGEEKLVYASLETATKSKELYWFAPPGQAGGWFDANGRSIIRSLMRTPVEGARISSPFGLRMHPILGFMKMHNGVDFAAPVGTPIYAAGDGVVEFSGPKGPDGNFVRILHPNGWQTLYLHQNKIMPAVIAGAHVTQGQQIGEVGATGVDRAGRSTVTGPHLHYEVHINNVPVDPMSIPVGAGQTLQGPALQAFIKERNRIDALRAAQNG